MLNDKKEIKEDSLADLAIDPDVLAKELAVELEVDPLEEIDNDGFSKNNLDVSSECDKALEFLKGNREERIQGLRIFCEYRDNRAFHLLLPLLEQPCPVERMSAVYALGRNPCPDAVEKLVNLLEFDDNAYVRRATAWSLANYDNQIVLKPLINALKNDVSSVRLWASGSLAEIGSLTSENAQSAAEQLLISLKIDNEPVVRSNCIWSLCRLYESLNNQLQESFVDECTKIALFDKEPSVMEEAKTALDSMGMKGFYK
tara:strand:- start:2620 stop:3393 length:774 start_codon:yes stop_codon:yes gene_type:complete